VTDTSVLLSEARKSLFMPDTIIADANGEFLMDAEVRATIKGGRLFVVENLLPLKLYEQSNDAYAAIEDGSLSTRFPITSVLATFANRNETILIITLPPEKNKDGEAEALGEVLAAVRRPDNSVQWSTPASDYRSAVVAYIPAILSFIADARSTVTRIEADDKLNKARCRSASRFRSSHCRR
jgi:hypothetical protein